MNEPRMEDRDPALQALFAEARDELPEAEFTGRTMAEIDRLRRRAVIAWGLIGLVLLVVAGLLASALQDAVVLLTGGLNLSLVQIDNQMVAELLSPLNTVASAVALGLLGMVRLLRKVFA